MIRVNGATRPQYTHKSESTNIICRALRALIDKVSALFSCFSRKQKEMPKPTPSANREIILGNDPTFAKTQQGDYNRAANILIHQPILLKIVKELRNCGINKTSPKAIELIGQLPETLRFEYVAFYKNNFLSGTKTFTGQADRILPFFEMLTDRHARTKRVL